MAVPLGISTSQPLVAVRTLPAEERPVSYLLERIFGKYSHHEKITSTEVSLGDESLRLTLYKTGRIKFKIQGLKYKVQDH